MPELPEVESVRRQLDPALAGRTVVQVWADPIPSIPRQFTGLDRLAGRTIARVSRRGKFLIAPLDRDLELIMHLGMTGQLGFDLLGDPYVRARLRFDDERTLTFRDVRR
ncbi:MAG: DNA-formamidopyrimidine glycosylase, partial [Actinobacteria bacterium]|nr:DNA-formamidopyrimidine glycosylase [Actinomycetota bacterium]